MQKINGNTIKTNVGFLTTNNRLNIQVDNTVKQILFGHVYKFIKFINQIRANRTNVTSWYHSITSNRDNTGVEGDNTDVDKMKKKKISFLIHLVYF